MHVAAETVELCHDDRGFQFLCRLQRCCKLRSPIERIGTLSGFNLLEHLNELEPFSLSKPDELGLLCFKAQTGLALAKKRADQKWPARSWFSSAYFQPAVSLRLGERVFSLSPSQCLPFCTLEWSGRRTKLTLTGPIGDVSFALKPAAFKFFRYNL